MNPIVRHLSSETICMDATFVSDETLDQLPTPSQIGKARVGGIDLNKPRTRAVLSAILSLACCPHGFTAGHLADRVRSTSRMADSNYDVRRAAYDIKKFRGKGLVSKLPNSHRYAIPQQAVRTIAALVIVREKLLRRPRCRSQTPKQPPTQKLYFNRPTLRELAPRHVHPHAGPSDHRLAIGKILSILILQAPRKNSGKQQPRGQECPHHTLVTSVIWRVQGF
jgi:hypothetical protein